MTPDSESDSPTLHLLSARDVDLAIWEWPGSDPALVFAHATGFHGRCWDRIARCFAGRRRLAVDFRGHGRSSKPEPPYHWRDFGRELTALMEQLGVRGALGIGHSMGGHSVVASVALRPRTFSALLLIDPTILPPEYYGHRLLDVSFVERRRNRWASPDEMFERFRDRPPFAGWRPEILRDYCDFGLLPEGRGFVLACPPRVEASIYNHSTEPEANLYSEIPSVAQPVVVLRAANLGTLDSFTLSSSPTPPDLASKFPHGREVHLTDRSHFIPMEWPEGVTAEIQQMLTLLE
ncbi:MAG TPA: alpha/beta hydrolase [Bryobacteraceae bacterium]|nr:alpha/beta hydrolase [Bryobacteraceae bacterium]